MNYSRGLFILGLFLFFCDVASAATLYIDPGISTIYRGDAITTSVRIMPDQETAECINAADVVISYPESIVPIDVSIGQSIFSVWVESPVINKEDRTITFAGGIPNGYCGRVEGDPSLTNVLAEIVFRSPGLQVGMADASGSAVIDFASDTAVYLNDGFGTKAPLRLLPSTITLERTAGPGVVDEWREDVRSDVIPPENFSISLERDTNAFSGKYFIVFSTTDKQTGISHYEVIEEPLQNKATFSWGRADAPWIRSISPYVLEDQTLNSTIRVRAVDKSGNEYVATLVPDESMRATTYGYHMLYAAIGITIILVVFAAGIFVWWRRKKARTVSEEKELEALIQ
jgi:hypothetical protein